MALVLRMKYVARFLLFLASAVLWAVVLFSFNDAILPRVDEAYLIGLAALIGLVQMYGLAYVLKT